MVLQTTAPMYSSSLRNAIETAGWIVLTNAPPRRSERRIDAAVRKNEKFREGKEEEREELGNFGKFREIGKHFPRNNEKFGETTRMARRDEVAATPSEKTRRVGFLSGRSACIKLN